MSLQLYYDRTHLADPIPADAIRARRDPDG